MVKDLLSELKDKDVDIRVQDGRLKLKIPVGMDAQSVVPRVKQFEKELIEYITSLSGAGSHAASVDKAALQSSYPLSMAQRRLFFLYQYDPYTLVYNNPSAVILRGNLKTADLQRALWQLIERHESLRTSFHITDGVAVQRIHENVDVPLRYEEIGEQSVSSILEKLVQPFRLDEAPLFRAVLIKTSVDEHILFTDIHHIIADAFSSDIFFSELADFYNGAEKEPLYIQYKDYAVWQQRKETRAWAAAQKEYWLNEFMPLPEYCCLPADFDRPVKKDYTGHAFDFEIGEALTNRLKQLAAQEGVTMFMLMFSAYYVLLTKLANTTDIVVGMPITGRADQHFKRVMGMFADTLAIRIRQPGMTHFNVLLATIKGQLLRAFDNQAYPYETLVEDLKIERDASRNPLFDVWFNYLNADAEKPVTLNGLTISPIQKQQRTSKFDLTLFVYEAGGRLRMSFEYSTELFCKETIERFVVYFNRIVELIAYNHTIRVADITVLSDKEWQALTASPYRHGQDHSAQPTMHELFEEQVAKTPDKWSVQEAGADLTYAQLSQRSNQVARLLLDNGIRRGDIVALMMPPGSEAIGAILGILKSGAAYLPVDPEYPDERVALILSDSKTNYLLTDKPRQSSSDLDVRQVDIRTASEYPADKLPGIVVGPDDMCYVIYTSGSTGKPKGVVVTHRSVANYIRWAKTYYFGSGRNTFCFYSSISFDLTVTSIFTPLVNGDAVYCLPGEDDVRAVLKHAFSSGEIDLIKLTPSHLVLLKSIDVKGLNNRPAMKLIVGGEELKMSLARDIFNKFKGHIEMYNEYGPTEATVGCMVYKFHPGDEELSVSLGNPIRDTEIYILDEFLKPLPAGVTGDLYVAGTGLAKGYLGNETLTQQRFMINVFRDGDRLYKTGDRAVRLPNGKVLYKGRNDEQLKIRGFRIEPEEIAHALEKIPGIEEAVVVARGENENKMLVGYYKGLDTYTEDFLRDELQKVLPGYMIPTRFIRLLDFSITPNGKLDKNRLPSPQPVAEDVITCPEDDDERHMLSLWADVLEVPEAAISTQADFFRIGGHSLKAMLLLGRVLKECGAKVSLKDFFEARTIKKLTVLVKSAVNEDFAEISKGPARAYYELSSTQRRLFFIHQYDEQSTAYNIPRFLRIKGPLMKEAFERALQAVINRHEALRTGIVTVGKIPVQNSVDTVTPAIAYFQSTEAGLPDIITRFVRPFALDKPPLLRVGCVTCGHDDYLLMFDIHHIISDITSGHILLNDFITYYKNEELPPLRLQYKDYVWWQAQRPHAWKEHQAFWLKEFEGGIPALELPADHVRPAMKTHEGRRADFYLAPDQTKQLEILAGQTGATLYMVVLSAFFVFLAKLSNEEDIVIGTPVAGRPHPDLEPVLGMFVNTLPVRMQLTGAVTFQEFVKAVKQKMLAVLSHQEYPYEELIEVLKVERDTGRNPLFDIMFVFDQNDQTSPVWPGFSVEAYHYPADTAKFDLTLTCVKSDDGLYFDFEYYTRLFLPATIERFIGYFKNLLWEIVQHTEAPLLALQLMRSDERHVILEGFNNYYKFIEKKVPVHRLFEAQVVRTPEAVAVVFNGTAVSYQELNARANRLASYLKHQHVGPNVVVSVMMNRSPQMVVALLAILKAGGAYLPLDHRHPPARIAYLLEDSKTRCLLTDELHHDVTDAVEVINLSHNDFSSFSSENLAGENVLDDLIYVIYTSGSTGRPKGAMINHGNMVNLLDFEKVAGIDFSAVLQFTTLSFDPSFLEIFGPLTAGGKVILIDQDTLESIPRLLEAIQHNGARTVYMPSSILNQIFNSSDFKDILPDTIKHFVTAGEQVIIGELLKSYMKMHGIHLHNHYGPAETHVVTAHTVLPVDPIPTMPHIGTPIQNTTIYIVDRFLNPQPVGIPGELYIGGAQVGTGYLHNDALTAEKFIHSPFREGDKLYKSGDLAKWNRDGTIDFLGRQDHQVKINGIRIELGEIESLLNSHELIKESVVVLSVRGDRKMLVAYYLADEILETSVMRAYLLNRLPSYMVPNMYMRLKEFPYTPTGKLYRKGLPVPDVDVNDDYVAPESDIEQKLVEIWADVLAVKQDVISCEKSFFELGGNSFKAIVMGNRIQMEFNKGIPLRAFLQKPTVKEIALLIQSPVGNDSSENQMEYVF